MRNFVGNDAKPVTVITRIIRAGSEQAFEGAVKARYPVPCQFRVSWASI